MGIIVVYANTIVEAMPRSVPDLDARKAVQVAIKTKRPVTYILEEKFLMLRKQKVKRTVDLVQVGIKPGWGTRLPLHREGGHARRTGEINFLFGTNLVHNITTNEIGMTNRASNVDSRNSQE